MISWIAASGLVSGLMSAEVINDQRADESHSEEQESSDSSDSEDSELQLFKQTLKEQGVPTSKIKAASETDCREW